MKKFFAFLSIALICFVMAAATQAAPNIGGLASEVAGKAGYDTGVTEYTLSQTVGGIIRGALAIIGVIFLALTVYAGFLWMTAAGNEDQVDKSKKILTSSAIGLAIVGASYGITVFVMHIIIGASPPSTDVGTYDTSELKWGCCTVGDQQKAVCYQLAEQGQCNAKGGSWYNGVSCRSESPKPENLFHCKEFHDL